MDALDLSTSKNTAFIQIQASIDSAIAVSRAAYPNADLTNKLTPFDVRHEFASLTAAITQATSAVTVFPADSAQGDHVLDIHPKGLALCAALARTTAALKSLPGRVSQEDGVALLNSYEEVASKTGLLFSAINSRVGSFEHGVPGVIGHGLTIFKGLFQDLAAALSAVLPPSINADKVQGLHTSIQTTIEGSFDHSRNVSSN